MTWLGLGPLGAHPGTEELGAPGQLLRVGGVEFEF